MANDLSPSERLQALITGQAWSDGTLQGVLCDYLDGCDDEEAESLLSYFESRVVKPGESSDDFDEKYGLIQPDEGGMFEFEDIRNVDVHHVWTIIEGDHDTQWCAAGIHRVNRLGYVRSERPWTVGDEQFRWND